MRTPAPLIPRTVRLRRGRARLRARRGDQGFSLVELLVVVLILGILAGVVVFAVRDVGDRGLEAATATEARILQTAEEAHCAQEGSYAPSAEALRDAGYLADLPRYHDVQPAGPNDCNGTSYSVQRRPGGGPPGAGPQPEPACTVPGTTCPAPAPAHDVLQMAQLPDGTVMAIQVVPGTPPGGATQLWDPAGTASAPAAGTWSPPDPNPSGVVHTQPLLRLPAAQACGSHCGKWMYHVVPGQDTGGWRFFTSAPARQWSEVPGQPPRPAESSAWRQWVTGAVLLGANCGPNCGRVVISSGSATELYSPQGNSFEVVPSSTFLDPTGQRMAFHLAPLAGDQRGRVLLFTHFWNSTSTAMETAAKLYDPNDGDGDPFEAAAPSPFAFHDPRGGHLPTVSLPGGRVFVLADDARTGIAQAAIYDPAQAGLPGQGVGSWRVVPTCGPTCTLLAQLPSGRILAVAAGTTAMFLFDPDTATWAPTGQLADAAGARAAVVLGGSGCAPYCGKVLIAGQKDAPAALYTPPAG